jgi:hypothetical protein
MAAPAAIAAWAPPLVRRPRICAGINVCRAVDVHVGRPIHDVGVPARHLGVSAGDIRVLAGHIGGRVDGRPGAALCVDCTRLSTGASATMTGDELDQRIVRPDRGRRRSRRNRSK